jgi:2-polyprenyl-6-methoxyphenol hydroxylase-like FAD-dependent oxidoreductase
MAHTEGLKVIVIGAGSTGLLLAQGLKQVPIFSLHYPVAD